MAIEIHLIVLLILIGALVGISMSFVGQTGQGVVVPLILLLTGDVILAITVNLLNDFIAAISVAINYVREKEFYFRRNMLILLLVSSITSFLGALILILSPLNTIFGWFLPVFIILLGITIISKGFPTSESLKVTVQKIYKRILNHRKREKKIEFGEAPSENVTIIEDIKDNKLNNIIKPQSKLFFILAGVLGIIVGFNSGLFGANSGFIITLVLIILYGYPLKKSVGTALLLSIIMCIFTFISYQVLGYIIEGQLFFNWEFVLYLGIGSFFTGLIISNYVQSLSAIAMGRGMGIIMITLGAFSIVFYFVS
ncbi:MAG: sulfite exporter TauE/SafE family protein [Promethearchaeota archaeon]